MQEYVVNPITNRWIQVGGSTYNTLVRGQSHKIVLQIQKADDMVYDKDIELLRKGLRMSGYEMKDINIDEDWFLSATVTCNATACDSIQSVFSYPYNESWQDMQRELCAYYLLMIRLSDHQDRGQFRFNYRCYVLPRCTRCTLPYI